MQKYLLFFILLGYIGLNYGQISSFDNSFGTGGKVIIDFGGLSDGANDLAIQNDGKIIVAGYCGNAAGKADFCACRLNPDGTLDNTFGTNGKVNINIQATDYNDIANEVHLQADGKMVLVGQTDNKYFASVRLNSDGTLDNTYGNGGKVFFGFSGNQGSVSYNSIMQNDEKIVMIGTGNIQSVNFNYAVARLNTDGSLDTDFSNDGKLLIQIPVSGYNYGYSITVDNIGNLYVGGKNTNSKPVAAKIDSNGNLVTSFGTNGIATFDSIPSGECRSLTIAPNGNIIGAGRSYQGGFDAFLIAFDSNGKLDSTFGSNGYASYDMDNHSEDMLFDVLIQSDGKIITTGSSYTGGVDYMLLNRFMADGSFDNTFSGDGIKLINVANNSSIGQGIMLQADGKLVAVGMRYGPYEDLAIVRLLLDNNIEIDNSTQNIFVLYPNPADNLLIIKGEQNRPFEYSILDTEGCIIKSATATYNTPIGIQDLAISNYLFIVKEKEVVKAIYKWQKK